eukprot:957707-Pyramimonas_sp.AAC.1
MISIGPGHVGPCKLRPSPPMRASKARASAGGAAGRIGCRRRHAALGRAGPGLPVADRPRWPWP